MYTWVGRYVHTAYGLRLERYLLGKMSTATACIRTQPQLSQVYSKNVQDVKNVLLLGLLSLFYGESEDLCREFIHVCLDKFSDFYEGPCYFYAALTNLYSVWDFTQCRLVVNYRRFGKPIGPIFKSHHFDP